MYLSSEEIVARLVQAFVQPCEMGWVPFPYAVVDFPIPNRDVFRLSDEIDLTTKWHTYDSPLEKKRTNCNWNDFGPGVYSFFTAMCSPTMAYEVGRLFGLSGLVPDFGLHGGGIHVAGVGDKLNVHQDYAIHPKVGLRRVVNIIFYVEPAWSRSFGGGLELWSGDGQPVKRYQTVDAVFNRMILFVTEPGSWHGFPEPLTCPDDVLRKSLAMYYLAPVTDGTPARFRANYAPTEAQAGDSEVLGLIEARRASTHQWGG